jgi:hypothetical protein
VAFDKLTEYSATNASNTVVGDVDVTEGMLPSNVNNAIRELMTHQKEAFGSGTPLYVDQTNNNVGIGTASPASLLHLDQGSGGAGLRLERDSYDTMDIELSESGFRIRNETDSRTDLFIDGSGNVGISTASPSTTLHAKGATASGVIRAEHNSSGVYAEITGSSGNAYLATGNNPLIFEVNSAERMRILSTGGLTFNGDTAAANALDDYEEGTWTPTASGGYTVSSSSGAYTKIGRVVHLWGTVQFSGVGGNTSTVVLGSAPFTNSTHLGTGVCRENTNTGAIYVFRIAPNSTSMEINTMTGVASGTRTIRTGENYAFHGSYYVA